MKFQEIDVKKITVKDRYRKDFGDIDAMAETIKQKGILQPIIVNTKLRLLGGERRFRAAQKAGLTKVPVVIRDTEGELDELEIELIENMYRKDFTWVERAKLEQRIYEMKSKVDPKWSNRRQAEMLQQAPGSTDRRLILARAVELIPELAEEENENRAWKKWKDLEHRAAVNAYAKKISKDGEDIAKWASDHFILTPAYEGLQKVSKEICQFAEVDPPYAIDLVDRKKKSKHTKQLTEIYTEVAPREYKDFVIPVAEETFRILSQHSYCIWWFGIEWYETVKQILRNVGFGVTDVPGIWDKGIPGQTSSPDTTLGSSYETFFVCRKGSPKLQKPGRSNAFDFSPVAPGQKIHATEKPIELYLELIDTFVFPGSRCLCPFLGSGNFLRALYRRKMVGFGYELDKTLKTNFLNRVKEDKMREEDEALTQEKKEQSDA